MFNIITIIKIKKKKILMWVGSYCFASKIYFDNKNISTQKYFSFFYSIQNHLLLVDRTVLEFTG